MTFSRQTVDYVTAAIDAIIGPTLTYFIHKVVKHDQFLIIDLVSGYHRVASCIATHSNGKLLSAA